ncbi:MAG: aminotransferase class IV [Campylobacterales bacterium]|nr:aminotransferase class IV [Campylobacterales bacterium]
MKNQNQEIYFETIKCKDYEVFHLEYHKARISNTISKNIDIHEYIYPPNKEYIKCKLTYNKDEILGVEYNEYSPKKIDSLKLVFDDTINYNKKRLDRTQIDKLYEQKQNGSDILIVKNNLLTDTSIANIALLINNIWYTPKTPLLEGTTRARLIDLGQIFEKDLQVDDLFTCQKIALMNAMIDFVVIDNLKILK